MKKKILFRMQTMEMGGAQKVLLDILEHLDREQFEVSLLLSYFYGDLKKEIPEDIDLYSITDGDKRFSGPLILRIFHRLRGKLHLALYRMFPHLLKKKLEFVPDVEVAFIHSGLRELVYSPFKDSKKINWFHSDIRF